MTKTQSTNTRYFFAGSPRKPGTQIPSNVTGDCPHRHRSPEAAQHCIDSLDRSIKRGHGHNAYADRVVMVHDESFLDDGRSSTQVWDEA